MAPKKTMLLAGVELKFVPVIVTVVPMGPLAGEKLVMVGTAGARRYLNTVHRLFVPPPYVIPYRNVPSEIREP